MYYHTGSHRAPQSSARLSAATFRWRGSRLHPPRGLKRPMASAFGCRRRSTGVRVGAATPPLRGGFSPPRFPPLHPHPRGY